MPKSFEFETTLRGRDVFGVAEIISHGVPRTKDDNPHESEEAEVEIAELHWLDVENEDESEIDLNTLTNTEIEKLAGEALDIYWS